MFVVLLFPDIFLKPAVLQFDQRQGSSDGGALLLKAADRRYGLIGCLAGCLQDERQAGKVDHSLKELLAQRVFSIACGYPDANDAARLAADPIHKMLLDRDPDAGRDLASQPTLSRFENAIGVKELYRLSEALAASVMQRHAQRLRGRVRRVTLDLDPTDDATHGAQQLSFFNRHYDTRCYLPVMGFVSFNDEAEPYLCAAVLRPGNVTAAAGAVGILRRLMQLIRRFLPGVCIRVRLDGGFAHPQLLAFLDAEPGVEYVVAMAKNAVLRRKAKRAMRQARKLSRRSGKTEHVYKEANYAAKTWPRERRILIKAEVVRADGKALEVVRFDGAAAGHVLGIEVQDHPFAAKMIEADLAPVLRWKSEIGSRGARLRYGSRVAGGWQQDQRGCDCEYENDCILHGSIFLSSV